MTRRYTGTGRCLQAHGEYQPDHPVSPHRCRCLRIEDHYEEHQCRCGETWKERR